ncbi:MAG: MmcQ/YjbR family DNA-binding protein, partial [Cytophagaceae bacterium]|nr:MmcQ/YjbR family DNA-binding protein [Cytophagaceae bacterium]
PEEQRAVLKLTPAEQQHLVATDPVTFSPIPGAWGQKGWTFVQFDNLEQESFQQVLLAAWRQVAPTRLVVAYGQPG